MTEQVLVHLSSGPTTGYLATPQEWTPITNLEEEGWTARKISHPGYVWGWIIVVVLIIILVIFVIFNSFWEDKNGLGQYGPPTLGQCNGTNACTDPGMRVVSRVCIPNPTTGKGCLLPSGDKAGTQSYETLISMEPCQTHCVTSIWKEVTPEDEPCLLPRRDTLSSVQGGSISVDFPETFTSQCVPAGSFGTKLRRFRCVNNDDTGTNGCTNLELEKMLGPTSQSGPKLTLSTLNVGDEVELDLLCEDFTINTCGEWLWTVPPPPNRPEELPSGTRVQECTFDTNLIPVPDCVVESNPINRDPRWDNLREGYQIFPLSCIYQDNDKIFGVTPAPMAPAVSQCMKLTPPNCTDQGIVPEQIRNGNIPTARTQDQPNTLLCAGTLNDGQNPTCYRPCRRFQDQFPRIGNGEFNPILGKLISIRWPGQGFLSLQHIPSSEKNVQPFEDTMSNPDDPLFDVKAMEINFGRNKPGCSQQATDFAATLLWSLGPRSYNSGVLNAQMMGLIGASYLGWMGIKGNDLFWQQAYNYYRGPGITSDNPKAIMFRVVVTSPFNPNPPPGFVAGTIGTIGLSIRDQSGQTIVVIGADGTHFNLNNIQAIVYDPETLNSDCRNDRGPLNCNLLYGRN